MIPSLTSFYTIKWLNSFPATKGMGNVFFLLAYNQSYFLIPAFLDGIWSGYKGACATNGLLAIVICWEIIFANAKYLTQKAPLTFAGGLQLLFLPLCINIGVQNLSSPYPDVIINLLTFRIFYELIRCMEAKTVSYQDLFLIAFYCVLGMTMKLSFIGVSIGAFAVIIWLFWVNRSWKIDLIIKSVILLLLLLIPWMIRGVISSGYIGFPSSFLGFPVDWKMPLKWLTFNRDYTIGFSRTRMHGNAPFIAAHNYAWVPDWTKRMLTSFGFDVPLLLLGGVLIALNKQRIKRTFLFIVLTPAYTCIVFWLLTAPDLRFVVFTFWGLGLVPLAYYIFQTQYKWERSFPIFICICAFLVIIRNWNTDPESLGDLPKQQFSIFTTRSGLQIHIIKGPLSNDDWQIMDCTIPCTVIPDTNLMLRGKNISDGFRIDQEEKRK